ncbi:hypothetical protein Q644_01035 [Brucella intermedia 229E]|uniref:Glyoxalase/bleomycin resistance protein/dioxygenase n=1 Tax=Brucella intermedia 229E TaxID=1337887 RepID=U4VL76_9HYPH|nr:hypothetical protein Q644_01035 [Brucella intermedia 229E]
MGDVRAEHARLSFDGIRPPGNIEAADYMMILRLRDPDRNLVVLAQPRS